MSYTYFWSSSLILLSSFSFGVIIASKNTKLFAKKLHRLDLSAGIFVFCWEFHVLRMFFTTAGKLFCPRILSFRSGSRWVRAHFLGKPKGLPEKRRTRISWDLPKAKPIRGIHKESILISVHIELLCFYRTPIFAKYTPIAITYYLIRAPETENVPLAVSMTSFPFWKDLRALLALATTGA